MSTGGQGQIWIEYWVEQPDESIANHPTKGTKDAKQQAKEKGKSKKGEQKLS